MTVSTVFFGNENAFKISFQNYWHIAFQKVNHQSYSDHNKGLICISRKLNWRGKNIKISENLLYLLISGKLNGYLATMNKHAEDMFYQLVKQMDWVARMNNIRSRYTEIVKTDSI